jgi:hypothetical protein
MKEEEEGQAEEGSHTQKVMFSAAYRNAGRKNMAEKTWGLQAGISHLLYRSRRHLMKLW